MKQKNKAILLGIVLWSNLVLGVSPPNPTGSDIRQNTAGGASVLLKNTVGVANTGFGSGTLASNTSGSFNTANGQFALNKNNIGYSNTAIGTGALSQNTSGHGNSACGVNALLSNTTGYDNTANGGGTLSSNRSGHDNTANGSSALNDNITGVYNTAIGSLSLLRNIKGNGNTANGYTALFNNQYGSYNTALGFGALSFNWAGNYNLALGINAGKNLFSGKFNIYLSNNGVETEDSTIRIGSANQKRAFLAGIRGTTTGLANAVPVVIDSNGQLGTINSSVRFKKDIQDMNEASHKLLQLRPVTYHYKQADESGGNPLEYGLIAEEVAKVYPDLVAYGADGKIETVQYQKLTPMILNELQHTNALLEAEKLKGKTQEDLLKTEQLKNQQQAQEIDNLKGQMTVLQTQAQRIEVLTSRLSRIEAQQSIGMLENNGQKLVHN